MIYARLKNPEEQKLLDDELKSAKDRNWYRRLQIIKLSAGKHTVQELSQDFDLCQQTIRNYIHAYNEGGLAELKPTKPPGRPPKIGNWTEADWDEVLGRTPDQYQKLNTQSRQWTLERLGMYLLKYHDIDVDISNIYRSLRKTGRRTGRSKLRVGSPDPKYKVKRKHTEDLRNLHARGN